MSVDWISRCQAIVEVLEREEAPLTVPELRAKLNNVALATFVYHMVHEGRLRRLPRKAFEKHARYEVAR